MEKGRAAMPGMIDHPETRSTMWPSLDNVIRTEGGFCRLARVRRTLRTRANERPKRLRNKASGHSNWTM